MLEKLKNINLTKEMEEKLILGIQVVLGILFILLSLRNGSRMESAQMKKVLEKDAKRAGKLHKKESGMQKKVMKRQYRIKMKKLKLAAKRVS